MVRSTALNLIVLSNESSNSQYCYSFILQRQCVLLCRDRAISTVNDYSHHDGNAETNNIAANFIKAHDIVAHEFGSDTPTNNEAADAAAHASANAAANKTANISADIARSDTRAYDSTKFRATQSAYIHADGAAVGRNFLAKPEHHIEPNCLKGYKNANQKTY
jgi:hypothetical protein